MLLDNEIQTTGLFWTTKNHETKWHGVLTVKKDGHIELKFIEFIEHGINNDLLESDAYETISEIYGITHEFGLVFCQNLKKSYEGFTKGVHAYQSIYDIKLLLTNLPSLNINPMIVMKLSFSTVRLNEWFISRQGAFQKLHEKINTLTIDLSTINNIKINAIETISTDSIPFQSKTQYLQYEIELIPDNHTNILTLKDTLHHLARFISFAMDDIFPINNISIYYQLDRLYCGSAYYPSVLSNKKISNNHHEFFLFTISQVKNIQRVIQNWFSLTKTIEPALNLYFAVHIHQENFLETRFILMAQCLETLHSWNTKTYNKRGRDFSFRYRIEELISPFKEYIKSPDDLSENITLIRNYYTHYNAENSKKLENLPETIRILYQMKAIFQLNVLRLLSFSEEEIDSIIRNNRQLQWSLWMIEE